LSEYAQSDREGLLCQLNSYASNQVSAPPIEITRDIPKTEQEKAASA
jgi:hypothetical protein